MSIQRPSIKHYLFLLAIIFTDIILMHDYVLMPVANNIYAAFPGKVAGVNFIISGPAVFSFLGSLLAPILVNKSSSKRVLVISCSVFAIASIFGASILSLGYMIASRSICGFCCGIVQVVALNIVTDSFSDENKRASFLGIYNASMAAIGAIMGIVAGNLAVTGWRNAYLTYLAAIPMVILVIFFVPNLNISSSTSSTSETSSDMSQKVPMGLRFRIMLINYMLINLCYTPIMMMSSVYIAENNLGNEAISGLATAISTIGGCVCCLAFGYLFGKLKAKTSLICYSTMALSLLCMYFYPNQIIFLIICFVSGGAYAMSLSYVMSICPTILAHQNIAKGISFLTAGAGFALFAGTYVITAITKLMPQHTVGSASLVFGIICTGCLIVEFITTRKTKAQV